MNSQGRTASLWGGKGGKEKGAGRRRGSGADERTGGGARERVVGQGYSTTDPEAGMDCKC